MENLNNNAFERIEAIKNDCPAAKDVDNKNRPLNKYGIAHYMGLKIKDCFNDCSCDNPYGGAPICMLKTKNIIAKHNRALEKIDAGIRHE
jgi:hypothetical protein